MKNNHTNQPKGQPTKNIYLIGDFEDGYTLTATDTKAEAIAEYKGQLQNHSCCLAVQRLTIPAKRDYSVDFGDFYLLDDNGEAIEYGERGDNVKIKEFETLGDHLGAFEFVDHLEICCAIQDYFENTWGDTTYMSDLAEYETIAEDRENRHGLKTEENNAEKYEVIPF